MSEQQLHNKVNADLDESVANLDELTLAKIKSARLTALEQAQSKLWWQKISLKQGLLATSMSLCLVALLIVPSGQEPQDNELALMAAMNPVLTEEPEMLSDLEFLAWLDQEQLLQQSAEFGT